MVETQITAGFGASVRTLRYRMGLSQEELAERAGLHQTYIAGIERGARNLTLMSIHKLARALEISAGDLLNQASGPSGRVALPKAESSIAEHVEILMVEDNRDDVELTLRAFKLARITNPVKVVHDGKEALDFLFSIGRYAHRKIEDRPCLILLDLNLPKIDGIEVLRRIKADPRTRSIPVAVLTASRDPRERAECKRLGAKTFIVKPVDFQGLSQATPHLNLDWALLRPPPAISGRAIRSEFG